MRVLEKEEGRIKLKIQAIPLGTDMCVLLSGGKEHIGALTYHYEKETNTIAFGEHKESFIMQDIATVLEENYDGNFVLCAGIHFDHITKEEIASVKKLSVELAEELCNQLTEK